MLANQAAAQTFTSREEGGYSDDGRDDGNWSSGRAGVGMLIGSNKGCGAPATIAYVASHDLEYNVNAAFMQALPDVIYDGMFAGLYWNVVKGNALPSGLDLSAVDFGWNTGSLTATHLLQQVVGVRSDGQIGPETLSAIASPPVTPILSALPVAFLRVVQAAYGMTGAALDGRAGPATRDAASASAQAKLVTVIAGFAAAQDLYYRRLANFGIYGPGWIARTGRRLAAAINLATATVGDNDVRI